VPAVTVICTTGVVCGLLDQLPAAQPPRSPVNITNISPKRWRNTRAVSRPPRTSAERHQPGDRHGRRAVKEFELVGVNPAAVTTDGFTDASRLEDFYTRVEELGVPLIIHPTHTAFGETLSDSDNAPRLTIGHPFC
jgi:aminocarboxymuconate-semialdehyde decarboxylase